MSERWIRRSVRGSVDIGGGSRSRGGSESPGLQVPAHPSDQDIVRRVRADRDAEAPDDEDPREEDTRHPAEDEGEPGEGLSGRTRVVGEREEQGRTGHREGAGEYLGGLEQAQEAEQDGYKHQVEERL